MGGGGLVRKKVKGKVRRIKFLQEARKLFKTTILEVQIKSVPQVRKGINGYLKDLHG